MKKIVLEPELLAAAPDYRLVLIECETQNSPTSPELTAMIDGECARMHDSLQISDINKRPAIAATRKAYKALGKDPNRYRPSAEALCRRAVKEKGLYTIDTLVDLINLVSMHTGYSIGGFDADHIEGDTLSLGVGRAGEPFEGIGRGPLNIEGLPVFRDAAGGIGTPTSDNERTKLSLSTRHLLMTVNIYGEETPVEETVAYIRDLLMRFAPFTRFEWEVVSQDCHVTGIGG